MTRVRKASPADLEAIRSVHLSAFPAEERGPIADLAIRLLTESSDPETLSLVAEQHGEVLGHTAFSPVFVEEKCTGYILAPLAVVPDRHGEGIGSLLVSHGIEQLQQAGAAMVFVYGDPDYYGRFGFDADQAAAYRAPYPLQYPFGWQLRVIGEVSQPAYPVTLACVEALQTPALW